MLRIGSQGRCAHGAVLSADRRRRRPRPRDGGHPRAEGGPPARNRRLRGRGRPGDPSPDRAAPALQRPGADRARGREGGVVALGRMSREPSAWMIRQVRYRDRECRFPGCGTRRFTEARHVRWWRHGGRTDLDNLLLICSFHHRLVHEHGWSVKRDPDGTVRWFRPDGTRHRAGPSPGAYADELVLLTAAG